MDITFFPFLQIGAFVFLLDKLEAYMSWYMQENHAIWSGEFHNAVLYLLYPMHEFLPLSNVRNFCALMRDVRRNIAIGQHDFSISKRFIDFEGGIKTINCIEKSCWPI